MEFIDYTDPRVSNPRMSIRNDARQIEALLQLAERVIASADNTGCSDDLSVVSQDAINMLEDFIVNNYGHD